MQAGDVLPILWFSAKTYWLENKTSDLEWDWADPFIHEKTDDEILKECENKPPDIFGFSVYVWNQTEAFTLSKKIKELYPNCLIIFGGPQIDIKYSNNFFTKQPWVDLVVPSDVYGEPILHHILDNFENLSYQDIPEVYYQRQGIKFRSKVQFNKRSFVWPKNIFEPHKEYFDLNKTSSLVIYETSRGCPYKCIYCDWGGGTYTKVVKKPMETIYSEIEFLCKNKLEQFFLADANFGIFKQDIEIVKFLIKMKEKYGYPVAIAVENAKNNLDRVMEIQELLIKHNLSYFFKVSIQNPHEEIKQNIERVDIPFDEYMAAVRKLKTKYDVPVLIETILGLPGDNYDRILESFDLILDDEINGYRASIWALLPEAPAYDPVMREKFKIQTKWFSVFSFPFKYKKDRIPDSGVTALTSESTLLVENVIGTYSYSINDWCDMYILSTLFSISKLTGVYFFAQYLKNQHKIAYSLFFKTLHQEIIKENKFTTQELKDKISQIDRNLKQLVESEDITSLEFDFNEELPFVLAPGPYLTLTIMVYPQDFFETVAQHFHTITNDDALLDLGRYLSGIMIDVNYDPIKKRQFKTSFNWKSYFEQGDQLTQGSYEIKILDDKLRFFQSGKFEDSDWPIQKTYSDKLKQLFYHRVANQARNKYAHNIIETKLNGEMND